MVINLRGGLVLFVDAGAGIAGTNVRGEPNEYRKDGILAGFSKISSRMLGGIDM